MPGTPRHPHRLPDTGLDSHNGLLPPPGTLPVNKATAHHASKAGANMHPYDAPQSASLQYVGTGSNAETTKMPAQVASTSQLRRTDVGTGSLIKRDHEMDNAMTSDTIDKLFSTVFKTGRSRAWEKSRQIDENEWAVSEQELLESLRPEEEGLVPLNAIAGRIVLYGWQLFANQVEINPSLSPLKRRKKIYDDAHEARKQLVKLLVLVQWSKVAPELKLARTLIAFINDHFAQTDAAVTSLSQTRSMLTNARLRAYDLATAIEVLGSGTPQKVPAILKDAADVQKRYSDREAVAMVKALDEAIRLRLASYEILPPMMASYTILDGRACFRVPKLFETEVTFSGSGVEDRWWLLRVKFDFRVTGSGVKRFPRHLKKQQRLQLLSAADIELAPRSVAAIAEQGAANDQIVQAIVDVEMGEADEPIPPIDSPGTAERRDAPLVRLFNLLQSQAFHYQLDILHYQVLQLIKLDWGPKLSGRMETVESTRVLWIPYWQRATVDASDTWKPTKSGSLSITVQNKTAETGIESVLKRLSSRSEAEDSEHGRGQKPERLCMQVDWEVQEPAKKYLDSSPLTIDAHDIDAEKLLLEVTQRHASAAVHAIKSRLCASSLMTTIQIQEIERDEGQGRSLLLCLSDEFSLTIRVEQKAGEIRLEGAAGSDLGNSEWRDRLREASTKVNERNDQIVYILQTLRSKVFLEDLEMKASLLGITFTTRMPLRQVDYASLQARPGTLLYVTLAQCPGYYLVLHVGDEAMRVALMCAGTFVEDLQTSMRIVSLEWLDWQRVVSTSKEERSAALKRKREPMLSQKHRRQSLSKEDVFRLYSYSVALISYHKVEQQLRGKEIPFVHVGGWTRTRRPPVSLIQRSDKSGSIADIVPSLCLDAGALLGAFRGQQRMRMMKRNISIQCCDWNDPTKTHVVFSIKLYAQAGLTSDGVLVDTVREKIEYWSDSSVLAFSFRDINNCLALFVASWGQIEKMLALSRELSDGDQAAFFTDVQCDLIKVRFSYDNDKLGAQFRWIQDGNSARGGFYHLSFDGLDNPHQVIRSTLSQWLNERDDSNELVWSRLLMILRRTIAILKQLVAISYNSSDKIESPELQVQNVEHYRLLFLEHYQLDIQLLSGNRILFSDQNGQTSTATTTTTSSSSMAQQQEGEVKDEFSLETTSPTSLRGSSTTVTASSAIPGFTTVVTELRARYEREVKKVNREKAAPEASTTTITSSSTASSPSPLALVVFTNGLLCSNDAETIDWIFPKLMEKIQAAITL